MDIELPSGLVITGIPEGATKEDIQAKVISSGMATEEDFTEFSELEADVLAGRKPKYMLQWYKDRKRDFIADRADYVVDEDSLNSTWLETEFGQVAGGIPAGIKGAEWGYKLMPPVHPVAKPVGGIIGGAIGSALGGGAGEGGTQIYQAYTDNPLAPRNYDESIERIMEAGGEEALYDVIGQTFFRGVGGLWSLIRPKPIKGIEEVQELFEEYGGVLTAAQRTDSTIISGIEGLTRVAWGGQRLRSVDILNDESIVRYADDYVSQIMATSNKELTDEGIGKLFINSVELGNKAHKSIANDMYGKLDELYKATKSTTTQIKTTPSAILGADGKMLSKKTAQQVTKEVLPVSTKGIKGVTNRVIKLQKELHGATMGDYGSSLVKSINKISGDGLSFKAAQELRSGLLSNIRGLSSKAGEGKTKKLMTDLVDQIDIAIEQGAKKTNNKEFISQWQSANKFWKEGKKHIGDKFISILLTGKNAERIGETVFASGNVTQIRQAKRALAKAASYTKGTKNEINFSSTWKKMQGGYLHSIIGKASNSETGEISTAILRNYLKKGTKEFRTFGSAFSKEQRKSIKKFIGNLEAIQRRPKAAGEFMVTVQQGALILNGFGLATGEISPETAAQITTFTLSPFILSRLLTNPRSANLLSRGMDLKTGGAQTGAVLAKLMAYITDIQPFTYKEK